MHQVTVTPEPLRQPSARCVAPRIRPMSLPWEGFSHKNSRMSVHPDSRCSWSCWNRGCRAPPGAAANKPHAAVTAFTGWNGLCGGGAWPQVCGPGAAIWRERVKVGGRWWSYPLGIARERMEGGEDVRPPSMPVHFLRLDSFGAAGSCAAWGLGSASCGFGLRVTDSMRYGRMPTLRALICQVSRG